MTELCQLDVVPATDAAAEIAARRRTLAAVGFGLVLVAAAVFRLDGFSAIHVFVLATAGWGSYMGVRMVKNSQFDPVCLP